MTPQLLDLNPGIGSSVSSERPEFVAIGERVIFNAFAGSGRDTLFSSDGTVGGTTVIKNRDTDLNGAQLFIGFGPRFLFNGNDTNTSVSPRFGSELWTTDGTAAGTVPVADIHAGPSTSSPTPLGVVGDVVLLAADDGTSGSELWRSDGTAQGTTFVKDIQAGSGSALVNVSTNEQAVIGNTLYFIANDGVHGAELWKSDGTTEGTVLVKDVLPGSRGSGLQHLTVLGETLFFTASDDVVGEELWKSDGTPAGTVLVKDIRPGAESSRIRDLVTFGNAVFFRANDGITGSELWKSDGSETGTVPIGDLNPGSAGSDPGNFLVVGKTLFFQAKDQVHGAELWKSDGTAAGTVPVADIRTGPDGSFPEELAAVGKTVFFTADDGVNGAELWRSDGTAVGTVLVQDLRPGSEGSFATGITALGNSLFFGADDGTHGREPWAMVFPNEAPSDVGVSSTSLPENNVAGAAVGDFTTTDPNGGDLHTYQLVSGAGSTDNASFTIDGDVLRAARRYNFELQDRFSIRVRSTDQGGLFTEKVFEITVTDVVDEPLVVESVTVPTAGSFRPGQVVPVTVTLSRTVAVVGRPQLPLQFGSVARRAVFASAATTPVLTFNYRVRPLDNADTVRVGSRLVFPVGSSIRSGPLFLAAPLPQVGQVVTGMRLDARPPRIVGTATSPAAGTFAIGQPLDFRVRFSEPVFVSGVPRINLAGLTTPRQAAFITGSGTQELTFRYVVQAGDRLVRTGGLTLGRRIGLGVPTPATIVDAAGNRALLAGVKTASLAGIVLATEVLPVS